jgi:hypothetical protein
LYEQAEEGLEAAAKHAHPLPDGCTVDPSRQYKGSEILNDAVA